MKTIRPGIRLKDTGKYYATKSIDGKRFYKEFDTLREAERWKNQFHPLVSPVVNQAFALQTPTVSDQSNGRNNSITFKEIYERYLKGKMRSLSAYKQYKKKLRMDRFLPPLFSVKMKDMTPEVITRLLEDAKLLANDKRGRCNFNEELKDLRSIFSWWKECDFTFQSPIMKYHADIGVIKEVQRKKKDMTEEQLLSFIECLDEPFQSMAIIQFCLALRVAEVAALSTETVDIKSRTVTISDSVVWIKSRPIPKMRTKTGDVTTMPMNEEMLARFILLDRLRPKGCKFFFNQDGKLLRYERIMKAYKTALSKAGLGQFSGTHFVRHTMGTLARRSSGLDAAQAILRHTTSRMSEHYARLDVGAKASGVVINAGEIFSRGRASNASKTDKKLCESGA